MDDPGHRTASIYREAVFWFVAALVVRLLFLAATPHVIDSADSIRYLEVAGRLVRGEFAQADLRIPLLYPALCAIVYGAAGDLEQAGLIVSLAASSALLLPLFLLASSMHGAQSARVAALMAVLWPWLVDYGCRVAPEALASFLWFLAIAALVRAARAPVAWSLAPAVVFYLLHLTRPEGLFVLFAAVPVLLVMGGSGGARSKAARCGVFTAAALVLFVVQAVALHSITGAATVTARASSATLEHVFIERGADTARAYRTLFSTVLPTMMGPLLLLFAGVGLLAPDRVPRNARLECLLLYFALVQFVLAGLSTYAEPRYIMNTVVALSLWSARGAVWTAGLTQSNWLRRMPVAAIVVLMLFGLAVNVAPHWLGRMTYQPVEYRIAGRWMKEHLEPGVILTRKPQVGFYAGMPTTGPDPADTWEDILRRAAEAKARYLVVDERYSTKMIPALEPLLDPSTAPADLRLLNADLSPYPQARIVVYEFAPSQPDP